MTKTIVFATTSRGLLAIPVEEALRLAAIHDAVWSSATWGELRSKLPPDDAAVARLAFRPDDEALDQGEIDGLEYGDWPLLPETALADWFPGLMGRGQLGRFLHTQCLATEDNSGIDIGATWSELQTWPNGDEDEEEEDEDEDEDERVERKDPADDASLPQPENPLEVFADAGYDLREDEDLIARAAGFNPAGESLILRTFPNRWPLAGRTILYNMASSGVRDLEIRACRDDTWEVIRAPHHYNWSEYDQFSGGEARWTGMGSGCLEARDLLEAVTDTMGYSESMYGYSDAKEFVGDVLAHPEPRISALGEKLQALLESGYPDDDDPEDDDA